VDLRELPEGVKEIEFDRVLLVSGEASVNVGAPLVSGARVVAEVVQDLVKGPKVYTVKYRPKKHSSRKTGHRQKYVQVRITRIVA